MEVEGNILPVDLRIEEIAVREIAKIQSKNIAEPVKQQLEEYLSREDIYEQESPFGKAINQSVDMFKATKVDIKLIEPEVTYKAGVDVKRPVAQRDPYCWQSFDLLHLLTRDSNKEKQTKINIIGGIHQKYRALPRTSKPCTPIMSLGNSILQYKEKVQ